MNAAPLHRIEVHVVPHVETDGGSLGQGAPANVYRSANYFVVDVGLPRCKPEHVRITLAPNGLLVEADRHDGVGAAEKGRRYALHELPEGPVTRAFPLSTLDLALHDAEAHFGNGMLTVSIPTTQRDTYRHVVRGEPHT